MSARGRKVVLPTKRGREREREREEKIGDGDSNKSSPSDHLISSLRASLLMVMLSAVSISFN